MRPRSARTVIAAVAQPHQVNGHEIRIGVSVGISVFPTDGDDAETLLKHADMALYGAKQLGAGRYQFFQPDLNGRALERRALEAGLYEALAHDEFELFYQPKVDLRTGVITGAEALIRWRHPDRGLVPPAEFVPIAEACGLIGPIGSWVLHEACRQARAWQDAGLRPIPVAVNVSAVEFRSGDLLKNVAATLTATRPRSPLPRTGADRKCADGARDRHGGGAPRAQAPRRAVGDRRFRHRLVQLELSGTVSD